MALNKISINDTTPVNTGVVYDITKATSQSYDSLSAALGTDGNNVPSEVREGGMTVRFVLTSDNKYRQARCMAQNFTTDVTQWQAVDDEPTAGSHNLIESGGVPPIKVEEQIIGDLAFADLIGNYLLLITDHIKTKSFDSKETVEKIQQIVETLSNTPQFANSDLFDSGIADENSNVLFALCEGHLKTKKFDSKEAVEKIQQIVDTLATIQGELDKWEDIVENLPRVSQYKDLSETLEYVTVLSDDFDSQPNVWSESWNRQNGTFTPQSLNQVAKTYKRFFSDKRQIRIKTTLYNDVVLQIYSTNAQEASTYTIDLVNKKITLGTEEFSIQDLSITNGAIHEIAISLQNFVTKVSIYNTKTNGIQEVQMFGRQSYELKGHFCIKQTQGTLISLSDFSISILKNPTILFLGDSITAGAYFTSTDEANAMYVYHMYTKLIGNDIENCMSVSAGGGGMTEFAEMWTNEISHTNPKAISALVGTNGGFTLQQITTLMSNLLTVTQKLFVHHLFGTNSYHLADYNQILEEALAQKEFSDVKSARLDIVTSTQKSEDTAENVTLDTSLMFDGVIHPNYNGSKAIVDRMKFDCSDLFRLN